MGIALRCFGLERRTPNAKRNRRHEVRDRIAAPPQILSSLPRKNFEEKIGGVTGIGAPASAGNHGVLNPTELYSA